MAQNRARFGKAIKKGEHYNAAEDFQKAMGAYRVAISEFPKSPDPYLGLGEACLGLKQYQKALDCFKLATRYSGGDINNLRKVADVQERLGLLTEAGRTYMAGGELLLRQRQFDRAISMWQLAVRLEPGLLAAHRRLAMVFQRQNRVRDAVREYLAIARILHDRGDKRKALQMCEAALRLDPENEDVLFAAKLIRDGEMALVDLDLEVEVEEEQPIIDESDDGMTQMVREMANVLAAEAEEKQEPAVTDPVENARRIAQEQLAEEVFREDEDEVAGQNRLTKLERDALIGQAMDFELRGYIKEAIGCYEKALLGGVRLPAAFFSLGLLYLKRDQKDSARRSLSLAARDPVYLKASKLALSEH